MRRCDPHEFRDDRLKQLDRTHRTYDYRDRRRQGLLSECAKQALIRRRRYLTELGRFEQLQREGLEPLEQPHPENTC